MAGNTVSKLELQCHTVNHSSSDDELRNVLELSRGVFDPDNLTPDAPQLSFSQWKDHLSKENATIFYVTKNHHEEHHMPDLSQQQDVSLSTTKPLGAFFAFPLTTPELGFQTLHLWIACVDPSARGLGIFPFLMESLVKHAREVGGFEYLSVVTMPKRFVKMYRILQANGWEFIGWRNDGEKVLMKLKL